MPFSRLLSRLMFRRGTITGASVMGALTWALGVGGFAGRPCSAQEPAPDGKSIPSSATSGAAVAKNSAGVPFVEVPGTPVLFAAWETRVGDFMTFVRESNYSWDFRPSFPQSDDHPVVNVTLRDAMAYCLWLTKREQDAGTLSALQSYRLPTRKEWDAAVGLSAGRKPNPLTIELERDRQAFPWGLDWPPSVQAGNLNSAEISGKDDGFTYTAPVGKFVPSAEGIYDLAGNVWEWTWDRETQAESAGILRGGSWMYFRKECLLSGYQYEVPATLRSPSIGFRCVLDDKQRAAMLLVKAKEDTDAKRAADRTNMASNTPAVSPEEVKKMRDEMAAKSQGGPKGATGPQVPALATLQPAKAGQPFTNTLGMMFRPLDGEPPLLMGVHEVRVQDYEAAMKALGKSWDRKPSFTVTETHPIVNVTWQESVQFCAWLTEQERKVGLIGAGDRYRLPKDVEWSRAAGLVGEKGDSPERRHLADGLEYPWGRDPDPPSKSANLDSARMTNGYQDSFSHTAPVGSFDPNKAGLHDLAGNVAEWCEDAWPSAAGERVIRGSSWLSSSPETLLTSARQHLSETFSRPDTGFRVVLEVAR